jgi:hypothetical protein
MIKRYNFCLVLLSLLLSLLAAPKLNAQRIDMSGAVGFDRYGSTVTLSASKIQNYGGSTSGTLALQLWATSMPYYGQSMLYGHKLAEASLGALWGGYYLSNINRTVAFYEPPQGYYNTVLVVGEWDGSRYLIVDWYNFVGVENFGGLPPYTPPSAPPALDLIDEYVGTWEGTQNFVFNGTSYDMTSTSLITRYGDIGFYSKTYIRTPGQLLAEGETWQYDNGTMYGVVKSEGTVIGTITGAWSVSGRSIISNISAVAGDLAYTQYVNNSFPDSGTMVSTTTTSYGASGSGTAKKISTFSAPTLAPNLPTSGVTPVSSASGGQVKKPKKGAKGKSSAKKSSSSKKSSGKSSKKASGKKKSKK